MTAKKMDIDGYIAKSEPFARPILEHLRKTVHKACPDIEESIKWSFPNFVYNGSILCHMAAFKEHCTFGFWLSGQMKDPQRIFSVSTKNNGMGQFGKICSLPDLPKTAVIKQYLKEAMELVNSGAKLERSAVAKTEKTMQLPGDFKKLLSANKVIIENFNNFSPSRKREYINWITDAKSDKTREKRLNLAVVWISEGKPRNWKYMK